MYAVIKTGGKQYKVEAGQVLRVEKLAGAAGDKVTFGEVLPIGGEKTKLGQPTVAGAKVLADVVTYADMGAEEQGRPSTAKSRGPGPNLLVSKYRRRKAYRRKNSHRQAFTAVKIKSITA